MTTELFPDEYADVTVRLDRVEASLARIEETVARVDGLVEQVKPALAQVITEVQERGMVGLVSAMMAGMRS